MKNVIIGSETYADINRVKLNGVDGKECVFDDTSDATASASDILSGKTAYVNGSKVTGNIASQAAQTITPGTSDKTIASGKYLSGTQTIKGDANLVAGNIKSGVSIFGVTGSYEGSAKVYTTEVTLDAKEQKIPVTHNLGSMDILLAAAYLALDCVDRLENKDTISSVYIRTPFSANTTNDGKIKENIRLCNYWYVSSDGTSAYMMSGAPTYLPTITDENNITIKSYSPTYQFPAGLKIGIIIVAV